METQPGYETDLGRQHNRVDDVIPPADDEFRVVNVFTTPQQNILAAKALCDTIEPMLTDDHVATPIVTWIKAMVTAAAIQHHQEGGRALSISRPAASR